MNVVKLNSELISPSKVVCIGRNYVEHIAELGNEIPENMVVFNKPNSSITDQLRAIHQEPLHYESELCFLVKGGQFAAVGFGLDLTKRALQSRLKEKGLPWERAKAFDGSALFSDFVAIKQDDINDALTLELVIDDIVVQRGGVDLMMYKPTEILAELKTYTQLIDGDIVMTGTPKGVGVVSALSHFVGKIYLNDKVLVEKSWQAL